MKIYNLYMHKSFEVEVSDIDFERTRLEGKSFRNDRFLKASSSSKWYGNEVFFKHGSAWKYPSCFFISKKTWEKILALENN